VSILSYFDLFLAFDHTCGVKCFPELSSTAEDNGSVVGVRPSSNWSMSLLVASTKTAGNNLVPGSIWKYTLSSISVKSLDMIRSGDSNLINVIGLLSIAGEVDYSGRSVNWTSNEHSLRCSFPWRVLRNLIEDLICSHHVAWITLDTNTYNKQLPCISHTFTSNSTFYLSTSPSNSSMAAMATVLTWSFENEVEWKWYCVVTHPTNTWVGSCPGNIRRPKKYSLIRLRHSVSKISSGTSSPPSCCWGPGDFLSGTVGAWTVRFVCSWQNIV